MNNVCGTGGWTGPNPGDPDNNAVISARAVFAGIEVSWTYPAINPNAVAHTLLYRGSSADFNSAVQIAVVSGNTHYDQIYSGNAITYWYWIRIVSVYGTVGTLLGPASATYQPTINQILGDLNSSLGETLLDQELRTKIDRITLTYDQLQTEVTNRLASNQAYSALMAQLEASVDGAVTLIMNETTQRTEGNNALVTQINAIGVANQNNAALISTETSARITADSALATQINTVLAQTNANTALIADEQLARTTADTALVADVDALVALTNANAAAILTEQTARSTGDSANATQITTLAATVTSNRTEALNASTAAQTAATNAQTAATNAQSSANTANAAIADISADDKWTAVEKQQIKLEWDGLVAEKSGINGQATAFGATAENTAYNNIYALLDRYLNGTTALSNATGAVSAGSNLLTNLVGTTNLDKTYTPSGGSATTLGNGARLIFADFYRLRQALMNAIYAAAKVLADNAQSSATAAQTAASNAQTTANTASTNATSALAQLTDISADDKWTAVEKQQLKIEWDGIVAAKAGINAQGTSYGLTTENTAYDVAYALLNQYLNGTTALTNAAGTVSAGTNLFSSLTTTSSLDKTYTPAGGSATTLGGGARKVFADFYAARQALLNAISARAKFLADAAQTTASSAQTAASNAQTTANTASTNATSALNQLTDISADDKWTAVEKQQIKIEWDGIVAEKSGINTQGTNYVRTTENTNYNNAYALLNQYLNATVLLTNAAGTVGAGSNLLSSLTTTSNLDKTYTPAGGAALTQGAACRRVFSDFYAARQALLNAIHAQAKVLADNAQGTATTASAAIQEVKTARVGYSVKSGTTIPYDGNGTQIVYPEATYPTATYPEYAVNRTRIIDKVGVTNWNALAVGATTPLQWLVGLPLASAVSTYQVTDGNGNIASVSQAFTAQKTLNDALKAQYTVKLDVNGLVGGFGITNDGATIQAGFNVDQFYIGSTQANKTKPFVITNGVVYIENARIANAAIDMLKIQEFAVTVPSVNGALCDTSISTDGYWNGPQIPIACEINKPVLIWAHYDPIVIAYTGTPQGGYSMLVDVSNVSTRNTSLTNGAVAFGAVWPVVYYNEGVNGYENNYNQTTLMGLFVPPSTGTFYINGRSKLFNHSCRLVALHVKR